MSENKTTQLIHEHMKYFLAHTNLRSEKFDVVHVPASLVKSGISYTSTKEYTEYITNMKTKLQGIHKDATSSKAKLLIDFSFQDKCAAWGKIDGDGPFVLLRPNNTDGDPIKNPHDPSNWSIMPMALLKRFFGRSPKSMLDSPQKNLVYEMKKSGKERPFVDLRYCLKLYKDTNPDLVESIRVVPPLLS